MSRTGVFARQSSAAGTGRVALPAAGVIGGLAVLSIAAPGLRAWLELGTAVLGVAVGLGCIALALVVGRAHYQAARRPDEQSAPVHVLSPRAHGVQPVDADTTRQEAA